MSLNTYYGRDARFYQGATVIAHSRSLSVEASAEIIKIRSNDSLQPIKQKVGEQTFKWSVERLFTGKANLVLFMAGTAVDIVFGPEGGIDDDDMETWKNCVITNIGRKTADGIIENMSGEATTVEFPA